MPFLVIMNFFDYLIIYLACAAPLGVFYFLQNRRKRTGIRLLLTTIFTFICWLPFAYRLLENKTRKIFSADRKAFIKDDKTDTEIILFTKRLEEVLQKSNLPISIFELREVAERYVGLTLAKHCEATPTTEPEKEIFRVAKVDKVNIGALCLNRRNLKRLTFHQTQARRDFFQIISQLFRFASDKEKFVKSATNFFRLLNDAEAESTIEKALLDNLRNKINFIANSSENLLSIRI